MEGLYCKGKAINDQLSKLETLKIYDEERIMEYKARLNCMYDLGLIDEEKMLDILHHYELLKVRYLTHGRKETEKVGH